MRLTTALSAAAAVLMTAGMAAADAKIYAYPASANYCPAGLQPITISGVICCGTPNQSVSYSHMNAHPVVRRKKHHAHRPVVRSATAHCKAGHKGCD